MATMDPAALERRRAALNYVHFVYTTGIELPTLGDAISQQNFDAVVELAARKTRRRTQTYAFTAADIAAAVRTATAWGILATQDGRLVGHHESAGQPLAIFGVRPDGQAASFPPKQVLAGDPAPGPAETDVANSVATVSKDQPWTIAVTTGGALVMRMAGQVKFAVLPDRRVYTSGAGFLKTDRPFAIVVAPELRRLWPPPAWQSAYGDWRLSVTYGGEFVIARGDANLVVIDPDGSVWLAGAGGKASARASDAAVASSPSGAALAAATVISIGGTAYNSASSWVTGAAGDVAGWFKGAAGSVEDGFDTGLQFTEATAGDAARWLTGAGVDTGNAIADAATQAGNAIAGTATDAGNAIAGAATQAASGVVDVAKKAGEGIESVGRTVGHALDPTSW